MTVRVPRAALVAALALLGACDRRPDDDERSVASAGFDPAAWRAPADTEIPGDSLGAAIRRGQALILHTPDSLPAYAPGNISCSNCHLDAGRNPTAAPLTGSHARFPKYLDRTGAVIGLADRVNYCFTRSLAGSRLPTDSREMQDILAYIAWLSRDVPVGAGGQLAGATGIPAMAETLTGDTVRGKQVYAAKCVACHQLDGQGMRAPGVAFPALWGAKSFAVGASMTRQSKAASFIWHNMPLGAGKSLTPQEAWDVAAYVTAQARPDSPGKERDWPNGGAPADVPYATPGRSAHLPPPVLPRAHPDRAIVDVPRRAGGSGAHER